MAIFSRFFPESLSSGPARSRLRERLAEAGGVGLWILALCLAIALWSYDPRDPSANTSSAQPPGNLLGRPGAYMADFMLQDFGIVGTLAIFCLMAWGWRLIRHHGLASALLRLIALLCGLPVIAADVAALPLLMGLHAPQWPTQAGLGGAVGLSVAHMSIQAATVFMGRGGPLLVWVLGLVLGALLVLLALALSLSEWQGMGRGLVFGLRQPVVLTAWLRRMTARPEAGQGRGQAPACPPAAQAAPAAAPSSSMAALIEEEDEPLFNTGLTAPAPHAEAPRPAQAAATGTGLMPVNDTAPSSSLRAPDTANMPATTARPKDAAPPALPGNRKVEGGRPAQVSLQSNWMLPPGMDEDVPQPLLVGGDDPATDRAPWHDEPAPPENRPVTDHPGTPPAVEEPARPNIFSRLFSGGSRAEEPAARADAYDSPAPAASAATPAYTPPQQPQWQFPSLSLLTPPPPASTTKPTEELLKANAAQLVTVLSEYGVQGTIVAYHAGPVVTLYELQPAAGIRAARVIGLADDVARSLSVLSVRIATVPGRNVIGIEVPNSRRETVYFSELLMDPRWAHSPRGSTLRLARISRVNRFIATLPPCPTC